MDTPGFSIMNILPFFIMAAVVFGIVFAVVAVVEGRHAADKGKLIKQVYLYLVAILTLLISVSSIGYLLMTGLKSGVFTKADDYDRRAYPPQPLYISSEKADPSTAYACGSECELSDAQKDQIENWTSEFQNWQKGQTLTARRQNDFVSSLSLLIVAIPLFLIHYRAILRDHKQANEDERSHKVIRPTYYYVASFVGLGMIIVFGSMLVNTLLRTYVFPKASDIDSNQMYSYSLPVSDTHSLDSVKNCAQACGLSANSQQAVADYQTAYKDWQGRNTSEGRFQSQLALDLAFLLVSIPLFWYHWTVVRRETRSNSDVGVAHS